MPILARRWNHNTNYHGALLRRLPRRCGRVLDVGCGDGAFARALAGRSVSVVALDPDAEQAAQARRACAGKVNVRVLQADFLSADLPAASFDAVTALAPAIAKATGLLRPGGRLLVLGVWTDNYTACDTAVNHAAGAMNRLYRLCWGPDRMESPATMPDTTLATVRQEAAHLLPGVSIRRHLLWRYILTWRKPYPSDDD